MSTATAEAPVAPAKGKKKLIIIIASAVLLLAVGGGGAAVFVMKRNAAAAAAAAEADPDAAEAADHAPAKAGASKHDAHSMPVFVPLEAFTVNLADRDAERYAQIGITLEIAESVTGDQIKAYMPAIRNNILMAISERTAADLMGREGKAKLAARVMRETSRALGFEVEDEEDDAAATDEPAQAAAKVKKKKKAPAALPVKAVHFSNFIIQ